MYRKFFKRFFDVLFSIIAMPFLGIAILIFAPIIHFTDKGPVFYNASRLGKNGKIFKMYKFRSMHVNAPDIRLSDGSTYNGEDDPRVTKVGRFIRKTSIDELPQLLNVLDGSMSIIGPRPDPPDDLERYTDDVKVLLTVRPGITGYCQAYWRNGATGREKTEADAYYALNYSFAFDIKILFRTVLTVFKRSNTYRNTENESDALREVEELRISN